jgi:Holliday junction resolvasome RuvABC endonuclease subunit
MKVLGIDSDSKQITAVLIEGENEQFISSFNIFSKNANWEDRFSELDYAFKRFLQDLPDVDLVCVEEAIYRENPKTTIRLSHIVGMIHSVCVSRGFECKTVAPTEWKSVVLGKGLGKATKEQVRDIVLIKYPDLDKDKETHFYDALCIAIWGIRTLVEKGNTE